MFGAARRFLPLFAVALVATGCGANGSPSASAQPSAAAIAAVATAHHVQSQPGDLALDYISAASYPKLRVEIDYIAGVGPSLDALDRARRVWEKRLGKPGGIDIVIDTEIPATYRRDRWEMGDLLALEAQFRRHWTGDAADRDTAVIWMVYLKGASEYDEGPSRALGLAFGGSDVAIFRDNLERTTFPGTRETVEAMVLVHETGHLMGLVNNGLPMIGGHEDAGFPRHDESPDCVMHHQIETGDVKRLLTNPPIDFDLACRLDLYAAGGVDPEAPPGTEPLHAPLPAAPAAPHAGRGPIADMAVIPLPLR